MTTPGDDRFTGHDRLTGGDRSAGTADAARADAVDEYRALLRSAEQLLDGVDHALASLDAGTYGSCEACGAPIGDGVLEEDPVATRCAAHPVTA